MRSRVFTARIRVGYDASKTDPESLTTAIETMIEIALSTHGLLDDYGPVTIEIYEIEAR